MKDEKYGFLYGLITGLAASLDKAVLETNIGRLQEMCDGSPVAELLRPDDPGFMTFYLLYLLLARLSLSYIKQEGLELDSTKARPILECLALLATVLQNGDNPWTYETYSKALSEDKIPVDYSAISSGLEEGNIKLSAIYIDYFTKLLPDILWPSYNERVSSFADMADKAMGFLATEVNQAVKVGTTKEITKGQDGHFQLPL